MSAPAEHYRPDIDGLRAIAVLAVVIFHAVPQWLPGGFVGVDVFFVISGYLISGQLLAACRAGTFSLADFYTRRIRRIFPALGLVLLATAVVGWFALLPPEWAELRTHLAASAFFSNNIVLWMQAGYFDAPSELKPLLHLWSLGVEEQFYLFWPVVLAITWRRGLRVAVIMAGIVLGSFALSVMLVADGSASAAFFLVHARLWQLAAGALLAAVSVAGKDPIASRLAQWLFVTPSAIDAQQVRNGMSLVGVLLMGSAMIGLDRGPSDPNWWSGGRITELGVAVRWLARALWLDGQPGAYPGWSAAAPTLGAALVLAAGPTAWLNRKWLSMTPMVFVGLISYPLYLWHWPMLSFLQITEQGQVSRPMALAAITAAFMLATATYLFVERPIRRWVTVATPWRVVVVAAPVFLLGAMMLVSATTGIMTPPARTATELDAAVPISQHESLCRERFAGLGEYCQQYSPVLPITTALLGDSHAAHFLPGLGSRLQEAGQNIVHLGQTGCPTLAGLERRGAVGDNNCLRVNRAVLDAVTADAAITRVVLAFRGVATGIGTAGRFRMSGQELPDDAAIGAGLRETIGLLQRSGKHVSLVMQVPELEFRVDECTGRPLSFSRRPVRVPCAVAASAVASRQRAYRDLVGQIAKEFPALQVFDPLAVLCSGDQCQAIADGQMLYHDDNHLGVNGSRHVTAGWAFQ